MTPHAGDPVLSVDRSRSIPDAPDLAVAPAVSPEAAPPRCECQQPMQQTPDGFWKCVNRECEGFGLAAKLPSAEAAPSRATTEARWYDPPDDPDADMEATIDEECKRQGIARASLTATTPEPMMPHEIMEATMVKFGYTPAQRAETYRMLDEQREQMTAMLNRSLDEANRAIEEAERDSTAEVPTASCLICGHLRALAAWHIPSRVGVCHPCCDAARASLYASKRIAVDRRLSTLERDAARMRGIEQAATAYIAAVDAPVGSADLIWDTRADLRRALSPSGEPTTTPEKP